MPPDPRWLSDDEQAAWRAFLLARQLLDDALDRQLQTDSGMPHAYYMILTTLIEADDHAMRMSELAAQLRFSPSRLTHAVTSLERSGWVVRRACPTDKRGQIAKLTAAGVRAQHAAAVGHVAEVRARLFDQLAPAQVNQLRRICAAIADGFDRDGVTASDSA
jgi:DNA-binding MarR family transcriptional regulator